MLIINLTILTILTILAIIWYYKKSNKNINIIIYPDLIHQKYERLDFIKNNEKLFNKVINYSSKKDFISFTYEGYFIDFESGTASIEIPSYITDGTTGTDNMTQLPDATKIYWDDSTQNNGNAKQLPS